MLALSVQVNRWSPKSAGTVMENTPQARRGRKWVGCPRSGPPGWIWLSGPIGMWTGSSFRLKYPSRIVNEPSALGYQPSSAGKIASPRFPSGSSGNGARGGWADAATLKKSTAARAVARVSRNL